MTHSQWARRALLIALTVLSLLPALPAEGGIEGGLTLSWPGMVGLMERGEDLDLGISASAFTDLPSRSALSLGIVARTNLVNGGISALASFRKSFPLSAPFNLEAALSLSGGFRTVGYPSMSPVWNLGAGVGLGLEWILTERLSLTLSQGIGLSWWPAHSGVSYPLGLGLRWRLPPAPGAADAPLP